MRQGITENISNYIKRYEELDKRIQISIDEMDEEFRDATRYREDKLRVQKFIRGIKSEIRLAVENKRPNTLRQAFQEAQRKDKEWREDEILRRNQQVKRNPIKDAQGYGNSNFSKPSSRIYEPHGSPQEKKDTFKFKYQPNQLKCKFCGKIGHSEEKCFQKNKNFQRSTSREKGPPARKATESSEEE